MKKLTFECNDFKWESEERNRFPKLAQILLRLIKSENWISNLTFAVNADQIEYIGLWIDEQKVS